MGGPDTTKWWQSPLVAVSALSASVALVAAAILSATTKDPAPFTIFVGRFHPLVVHLPIGALVLVTLLEGATAFPRFRDRIDGALAIALPAATAFAAMAFVFGLLLARGGEYAAKTVAWHRGLTLGAIVAMALTSIAYAALSGGAPRIVYRGLLGATMAVLTVGAHFGGTLSRGDDYLTRYAPAPVRKLLGLADEKEAAPAASSSGGEHLVYADVVAPLLQRTCVECHGPKTTKAKLRLDSLDAIMKGGESGPAAIAGNGEKSPLYARLVLPESSDDHMPPSGHPAPSAAERDLLRWCIDRGASDSLRVDDALPPPASRALLEGAAGVSGTAIAPSTSARPATSSSAAPAESSSAGSDSEPPPAPTPIPHPAADGLVYRDMVAPILSCAMRNVPRERETERKAPRRFACRAPRRWRERSGDRSRQRGVEPPPRAHAAACRERRSHAAREGRATFGRRDRDDRVLRGSRREGRHAGQRTSSEAPRNDTSHAHTNADAASDDGAASFDGISRRRAEHDAAAEHLGRCRADAAGSPASCDAPLGTRRHSAAFEREMR